MKLRRIALAVALPIALLTAIALATGATGATKVGSGKATATKSVCGLGNGKKATGAPIKLGGIDMLIRAGVKKIAIASPETLSAYADGGVVKLGAAKGVAVKVFPTHLPVTDASSQLLQMYQFAGDGNGIILDFTPDTAPAFMKAAISLGIVNKIKWGSSTPIANTFMSSQFKQFDGHLWINSEFGLLD